MAKEKSRCTTEVFYIPILTWRLLEIQSRRFNLKIKDKTS